MISLNTRSYSEFLFSLRIFIIFIIFKPRSYLFLKDGNDRESRVSIRYFFDKVFCKCVVSAWLSCGILQRADKYVVTNYMDY